MSPELRYREIANVIGQYWLDLLVAHGWLKPVRIQASHTGRRPAACYFLAADVRAALRRLVREGSPATAIAFPRAKKRLRQEPAMELDEAGLRQELAAFRA